MVFASLHSEARRSKNLLPAAAISWSWMASYPVSGPTRPNILELLLRMAPMWNCCAQPASASITAWSCRNALRNFSSSSAPGFFPARTALKTASISDSVYEAE